MTPHEFYLEVIGKAYDIDHYFSAQCWDGFAFFCQKFGYTVPSCIYSGGVKDIQRLYNEGKYNLTKNFKSVSVNSMKDGDWIVYGASQGGGYGHVAMFRKHNADGTICILGQNQGGYNGAFNQINFTKSGIIIVLRPNCFNVAPPKTQTVTWVDTYVRAGDKVKSKALSFQGIQGNCVKCKDLGGLVPLAHISEADSGDGKKDNILKSTKSKIYLDECTVEAVNVQKNLVKVHGYWVNAKPLLVKKLK